KDGIPENVPHSGKTAVPITLATLAGNHVIEELGGGRFAAYAHLRPGTIPVKPGDQVHPGEVLGKLGNSGNSSEPHLHFQICDAPSFADSEGLPFAIAKLKALGSATDAGDRWKLKMTGEKPISRIEPMENELDSFP